MIDVLIHIHPESQDEHIVYNLICLIYRLYLLLKLLFFFCLSSHLVPLFSCKERTLLTIIFHRFHTVSIFIGKRIVTKTTIHAVKYAERFYWSEKVYNTSTNTIKYRWKLFEHQCNATFYCLHSADSIAGTDFSAAKQIFGIGI